MKRIIASLMAAVVGTTAATSVVACGQKASTRTIDIYFGENLKYTGPGSDDYSENDNRQAYNGGPQSLYKSFDGRGFASLSSLLGPAINLFSLDITQFPNPNKVPNFRKQYVGMDKIEKEDENGKVIAIYKPSVDGLYFGEKFEKLNPTDFYAHYQNTSINSLGALYRLYIMSKDEKFDETQIGAGAQQSLALASQAFAAGTDGDKFINSFLSLSNQSVNSSWMSVKLSSDTVYKQLDSKILPYNIEKIDDKKSEFEFKPEDNPEVQYIGQTATEFLDVNTKIKAEEGHNDEKVGNRYKDPFSLLMLPPTTGIEENSAAFDTDSWSYPELPPDPTDEEKEEYQKALDALNGEKNWDIRTPDNGQLDWSIQAAYKSKDENVKGFIKTNNSVIVPVQPLKIQFVYSTDSKKLQAVKYTVDITIDGIQAVFSPILGNSQVEDTDKDKIANQFVKWRFNHYQFNNQVDLATIPGNAKRTENGSGLFSGMKITNLVINEIDPE